MPRKARKPLKRQAKVKTKPQLTMLDRLPKNEGEYLELLIKFTERAIKPYNPDQGMVTQLERLNKKLADYKASK